MLRKFALGVATILFPVGLVVGAAPGVASAAGNVPTVKHVAPHHGTANGGTAVAIVGTNLTGATVVDFGTKPARNFSVQSRKIIIAHSPSGTGVVDITVTTPNGTSAVGKADQFTYSGQPHPVVTSIDPRHGRQAGTTLVTIIGNDLEGATAVHFGANAATSVIVYSHHLVTARSPAGTGTVDVTVTTPAGTSPTTRKDEFTYSTKLPVVTRVTPKDGSPAGGTQVTIHGSNLTGATVVDFGTSTATGVSVITSHLITATSPAGSGTVGVTVTTPLGTSGPATGAEFTYADTGPVVNHVAPHKGPAAGGTLVAVNGKNLNGTTVVDFGPNAGTDVQVVSNKVVLARAPAGTGTVDVTVTSPNGTSAINTKAAFTYK